MPETLKQEEKRQKLAPGKMFDEERFQAWYKQRAQKHGLNPNPDDPGHFYDYRAAYMAGEEPGADGHWSSEFKLEGHPNMVVDGINTKTGKPAKPILERIGDAIMSLHPDYDVYLKQKAKEK